jgi:hypothetical protein
MAVDQRSGRSSHRNRPSKAALIKAPYNKKAEEELSQWRHKIKTCAPELKKKAEEEKAVLAKSGKTPAEIEQLKQEIDNRTEAEITKSEAQAASAIQSWRNASPGPAEFVEKFYKWIGDHERIANLQRAAEDRFSAALEELDRHIRGLGPFLRAQWKTIEGELAASETLDKSLSIELAAPNPRKISKHRDASRQSPRTIAARESGARAKTGRVAPGNR